ncbi:MAG: RHS repeat-associated core domain-containing protein, partial [Planctomycetes bacterium]|nr:RHS repeat-associated core domain-containing protein [Planctomycetota bacterium]
TTLAYTFDKKPVYTEKLAYNRVNNITRKEEDDADYFYEYDELDQLTAARSSHGTEKFYYDAAGNHLFDPKNPAKHSPTNALLEIPGQQSQYQYDLQGRTVKMQEPNKSMALVWNSWSQLKEVTVNGKKVKYLYDPFGRRVGKVFEDGRKEFYGYNREDIVAVYEGRLLKNTFLHGPGIDEVLGAHEADKKNYYIADYLGSVRETIDKSGANLATYDYKAFGDLKQEIKNATGLIPAAYAYTGRERDNESGWYYYRHRYYAVNGKQFMRQDPISFFGGLNLYAYAYNNPMRYIDSFGLYNTERHGEIIREGLRNSGLTQDQIQVVVSANNWFDLTTQGSSDSYKHSMTAPGQTKGAAMILRERFKQKILNQIKTSRAKRYKQVNSCELTPTEWTPQELKWFGQLQHPFVDENSASHQWQEWRAVDYVTNEDNYRTTHQTADDYLPATDLSKNAGIIQMLFQEASGF